MRFSSQCRKHITLRDWMWLRIRFYTSCMHLSVNVKHWSRICPCICVVVCFCTKWLIVCLLTACRNAMECHLCQKASGYVVVVSSRHHVLLIAVSVQTVVVHSNRPATAAGLTLHVRCGFPKLALQTTCFLSRSMDWREFRRLADVWRAACAGTALLVPAFSAIEPTATLHFTLPAHSWPVSTWRWHLYDWAVRAPVAVVLWELCARLPTVMFTHRDCSTMEI